jgi:hypothetical protein
MTGINLSTELQDGLTLIEQYSQTSQYFSFNFQPINYGVSQRVYFYFDVYVSQIQSLPDPGTGIVTTLYH